MPRLPDHITDCSIFLYPSDREAREGTNSGGSGFLAHVPSKIKVNWGYGYALTNKHVLDNGCKVIRLTKKTGGIDTIQTQRQDWLDHPDGDDVAVLALDVINTHKSWSVPTTLFITPEMADVYNIGLGDEAFLVGRLISHAGEQKNTPVVRFGNISLVADPEEPIRCEGREQEGFLVECRSLSGFSGSPVFVTTEQTYRGEDAERLIAYRNREANNPPAVNRRVTLSYSGTFGPMLLGIDWGHIQLLKDVYEKDGTTTSFRVEQNTGIACVLPAWKILEAIDQEELARDRKRAEKELAEMISKQGRAEGQSRREEK